MPDAQITVSAVSPAPAEYELSGAADFVLKAVNANMDGSGSASAWLPCVEIVSDSGHVVARAVDQSVSVAAGASAEVSWFPRVRRRSGATPAAVTRCSALGNGTGTTTLTITLSGPVPRDGVLHVVFAQVTIGDPSDANSAPTNVTDSKGVAGWKWPGMAGNPPLVGLCRQIGGFTDPNSTAQVGSVVRACTAGDLVGGDTITVTFGSVSPALFHTAGVIVWQRAFFEAIKNNNLVRYAEGDSHPDLGASQTELLWDNDGFSPFEHADRDSLTLQALGAYPAVAGVVPATGSVVGENAAGSVSIAAVCTETEVGVIAGLGGTWPSSADQLVGNFQLVYPRTFS